MTDAVHQDDTGSAGRATPSDVTIVRLSQDGAFMVLGEGVHVHFGPRQWTAARLDAAHRVRAGGAIWFREELDETVCQLDPFTGLTIPA